MYTSLNIHVEGIADQLYDQTVNVHVVVCEQLIKEYFVSCSGGPSRKSGSCDQDIQLSKDEMLSAMLVVRLYEKSLKKHEKEHVRKSYGKKLKNLRCV